MIPRPISPPLSPRPALSDITYSLGNGQPTLIGTPDAIKPVSRSIEARVSSGQDVMIQVSVELFEESIASEYPNEKRFGLEGCESLVPGMKALID
ncbi:uncharacterized protein IL334_004014 [Kwoniella shivajii]|uniref:Peptidylprolyl isomerase n=1 Tax=Kwoniella shivajii TaxID=564305 RepID=A0ABZ1CZR8_9TREE|nr:hypothetical protein IL334_004014 [Kwoniella shivajii]